MTFSRLYTLKEVCFGFGVSESTFKRKIRPVKKKLTKKEKRKRFYTERDITLIQKFFNGQ